VMPQELRVQKWPHFMEKKFIRPDQEYHSTNILGKLYDRVDLVGFRPTYELPADPRLIEAVRRTKNDDLMKWENMKIEARFMKKEYDSFIRRIMLQYGISTEYEVWSTFVMYHPRTSGNSYNFHEIIGDRRNALVDQFRLKVENHVGSKHPDILGPFVLAMYATTMEEVTIAIQEGGLKDVNEDFGQEIKNRPVQTMPFMSFPWLFAEVLGQNARAVGMIPNGNGHLAVAPTSPEVIESSSDLVDLDGRLTSGQEELLLDLDEDYLTSVLGVAVETKSSFGDDTSKEHVSIDPENIRSAGDNVEDTDDSKSSSTPLNELTQDDQGCEILNETLLLQTSPSELIDTNSGWVPVPLPVTATTGAAAIQVINQGRDAICAVQDTKQDMLECIPGTSNVSMETASDLMGLI
jgi:hypothetical protein